MGFPGPSAQGEAMGPQFTLDPDHRDCTLVLLDCLHSSESSKHLILDTLSPYTYPKTEIQPEGVEQHFVFWYLMSGFWRSYESAQRKCNRLDLEEKPSVECMKDYCMKRGLAMLQRHLDKWQANPKVVTKHVSKNFVDGKLELRFGELSFGERPNKRFRLSRAPVIYAMLSRAPSPDCKDSKEIGERWVGGER